MVGMYLNRVAGFVALSLAAVACTAGADTDSTSNDSLVGSPINPNFCKDGTIEREAGYIDSADGKECAQPRFHCITKDASKCPQLSPHSPNFCKDGTIVGGAPSYVSSADGKECSLPSIHCVTKDFSSCPQLSPRSPDFCKDGTIESGTSFISSADGKECSLPSVHCLTKDLMSCPIY